MIYIAPKKTKGIGIGYGFRRSVMDLSHSTVSAGFSSAVNHVGPKKVGETSKTAGPGACEVLRPSRVCKGASG